MLRDDDFSSRAKVDRYGRKLSKNAGREELKRYYRLEDDEEQNEQSEADEDVEVEEELDRINARDQGISSSEDSSSDDEDLDEDVEEEVFGLLNNQDGENDIPQGEVTSRLAVVNLDWDNIRAADLMAVFSSFVPANERIRKTSIYPSQFGKERIEKEELDGPPKEIFGSGKQTSPYDDQSSNSEVGDEAKDGEEGDKTEFERIKKSLLKGDPGQEFNSAKLRRYQLERLRYYYAVLDCSSVTAAQAIYNAVDGAEYLTTANFFDLRYIPDETDFSEDEPRDICERIPDGYRPNEFVTDALQHSKVRLTWDADDGSRKEAQKRAFGGSRAEIDENELKAYLGSDSSEDEGSKPVVIDATADVPGQSVQDERNAEKSGSMLSKKETERQRMRALLGLESEQIGRKKAQANGPVGDMQVTFSSGLTSEPKGGSIFENEPERDETTAEKYIRKEKERKARRKEKTKSSRNDTEHSEKTKTTAESQNQSAVHDEAEKDLGFSDPFFTAPSNDRAKTTAQRKADKRKKREERTAEEAASAAQRAELELLMIDDQAANKADMNHFDINEIAKAEKALSKNKKSKKKLNEREAQALKAKENDKFEIDVGDERFRDVFESHEFAIDPSHPRFKGTEGIQRILEEGRKKRQRRVSDGDENDAVGEKGEKIRKAKSRRIGGEGEDGDLKRLVDKVKEKTGKHKTAR